MKSSAQAKLFLWNLYPPFLGAGIRITYVSEDVSVIEARLRLHWWNKNYIGTLFGGSIYSLCDPFHMVVLMHQLGDGYIVRDKGAEVRFLKKSGPELKARFEIPEAHLEEIRRSPQEVQERRFLAQVKDPSGQVVAEVTKILHIRRKSPSTT